ncbi:MAG: carboxypeptidase regulatory-like domain-containing protein, partial [Candidatus Thorarchaeota archaeon]|nr:carboxypeptidase regulatory-like domain-containing protein [Candidatus Thorarchaeota archaeon]
MDRTLKIVILVSLGLLLMIPTTGDSNTNIANFSPISPDNSSQIADDQDEAPWWNSTYIYRRYYNFTEPGVTGRTLVPVHLPLDFEDGHCYWDSIRVNYYNGMDWMELPFQTWDTKYYPSGDFIESTRVSFMVNVTQGTTNGGYYIYYAKTSVGAVNNSDFYPFVYRSYTYSLINLVSYYDDNNYYIEKWESDSWDDPRINDNRWSAGEVTPNAVPNGVLDRYENARYEPTTYSNTPGYFWGTYAIYANYPLAVTMGIGDKNSNNALNDWYPGVDELGEGLSTTFILGGVEGFESRNEGKYWIQAHQDNTEVFVWNTDLSPTDPTGWTFSNGSSVSSWPAILKAGEYISKRDVVYTTYYMANSTKPVSIRAGDSDASYSRDIGGYYPSITGSLVGEEFYTIDMGNSNDRTCITNIGDSAVVVEWWRDSGSGWVKGTDLTIPVNSSALISQGTASSSDQEDILHIKGPSEARLMIEGIYNPTSIVDYGDWAPTMSGDRFGTDYRIWGGREMKFIIIALEDVLVDITGYNDEQLVISAGGVDVFMPISSSRSLYDVHSNASVCIIQAARFSTSSQAPSGDQGYGWMVPTYQSGGDQAGLIIDLGDEVKLFEFDIAVADLNNDPLAGVAIELQWTNGTPWVDDNGLGRSGTTDGNGQIVFEGLDNQTYLLYVEIDAATWLSTSYANLWVTDDVIQTPTSSVTSIDITLPLASIDIHLEDLMGDDMSDNDNEDTYLRLNTETGVYTSYVAQEKTDASGWVHFYRVPQDDYNVYAQYAGSSGWTYTYSNFDDFDSWSIAASEFILGDFVHDDWVLPLITLDIHVITWDDLPVDGATVKINNSVNELIYSETASTDSNGDYSFYRIVSGEWNLDVWKDDDYSVTPVARNNTITLSNLRDYTAQTVELPISQLNIRVFSGQTTYVENAQVNVTLKGVGQVAQGYTNATGHITFYFIHANMTSPYTVSYNITVKSGDAAAGIDPEILVKCDHDWHFVNNITITSLSYGQDYTELSSTKYFITTRWGRNATFSVGFYDRDGSDIFNPISFGSSSWLNFTIYYEGVPVGQGSWNSTGEDWIKWYNGILFNVTIDTDYWTMNWSETSYEVVFIGKSPLQPPAPITVYITVLPALTSDGLETLVISEYYKTHGTYLYWLEDITNGVNVTDLNIFTYTVREGTTTKRIGALIDNGDGTYSLPSSALQGLNVGTYFILVNLARLNYENSTIVTDAIISKLPMVVDISVPSDYMWSVDVNAAWIDFEYRIQHNDTPADLANVLVQI